jgi:hypothetical protein
MKKNIRFLLILVTLFISTFIITKPVYAAELDFTPEVCDDPSLADVSNWISPSDGGFWYWFDNVFEDIDMFLCNIQIWPWNWGNTQVIEQCKIEKANKQLREKAKEYCEELAAGNVKGAEKVQEVAQSRADQVKESAENIPELPAEMVPVVEESEKIAEDIGVDMKVDWSTVNLALNIDVDDLDRSVVCAKNSLGGCKDYASCVAAGGRWIKETDGKYNLATDKDTVDTGAFCGHLSASAGKTEDDPITEEECVGENGLISEKLQALIQELFTYIKYLVPLLLVVYVIIDLIRTIVSGDEDKMKKIQKTMLTRIAAAFGIFLLPSVLNFVLTITGIFSSGSGTCGIS